MALKECITANETNTIVASVVDNFALPFAVAVVSYWLFAKNDEYKKRKNYSRLGVAIIDALIEEVQNGLKLLENAKNTGTVSADKLPRKSWSGMSTIPDDVLLRILEVSKKIKPIGFHPSEIRIHCKNYFEHMTTNWDGVISGKLSALHYLSTYPEAAKGVLAMLEQTKELLHENSTKLFPK